jgi:hypothetical protein
MKTSKAIQSIEDMRATVAQRIAAAPPETKLEPKQARKPAAEPKPFPGRPLPETAPTTKEATADAAAMIQRHGATAAIRAFCNTLHGWKYEKASDIPEIGEACRAKALERFNEPDWEGDHMRDMGQR